jgi:hypothetical protein
MRCGRRWSPVRVLAKRGYRLPNQWWSCPNDCNAAGTPPYDRHSDPEPLSTASNGELATTIGSDASSILDVIGRPCSGEVLRIEDLLRDANLGDRDDS